MPSPIRSVRVVQRRMPLIVPFAVAYGTTEQAELTLVEFTDEQGMHGLGEGAPASYMTPEAKQRAMALTERLAQHCVGQSPVAALNFLRQEYIDLIGTDPIVYCAVELALLTLDAAQAGRSGPRALFPNWSGRGLDSCNTDITVPLIPVAQIGSFWQRYASYGFTTVKVKVSGKLQQDLERMAELEQVLPPSVQIFLDGNQGFTLDDAKQFLATIEQRGWRAPLFFEQPLPRQAWGDLGELSRSIGIPVCLDETVVTVADVQRVLKEKTATMINLKLMKSGVRESEAMLRLAHEHGMQVMIGGMVECEITMGASLDLFCASGAIQYADLDTPFFLLESLTTENPWSVHEAKLKPRNQLPKLLA